MATPPTFSDGTVVTAADLAFALDPPRGFISSTSGSFANTVKSVITFSTLGWDTDSMWSAGTPTRLTVKTPGLYVVTTSVIMAAANYNLLNINTRANAGASGTGGTSIYNYVPLNVAVTGTATAFVATNFVIEREFTTNDYVEVFVEQQSGATRTLVEARFQMRWVAYLS